MAQKPLNFSATSPTTHRWSKCERNSQRYTRRSFGYDWICQSGHAAPHSASALYNTPPIWPNTLPPSEVPAQCCRAIEGIWKPYAAEAAEYPSSPCEVSAPYCQRIAGVRLESKPSFQCEAAAPGRKDGSLRNSNIGTGAPTRPAAPRIFTDDCGRTLRNGSQPSRQRRLLAITATTASGAQWSVATPLALTERNNAAHGDRSSPKRRPVLTSARFGHLPEEKEQLPTNCWAPPPTPHPARLSKRIDTAR